MTSSAWLLILLAAGVMLLLGMGMSYILGRAQRAWHVQENPQIQRVEQALAGLDCGQCGHPTCNSYAHGIVEKAEPINKCLPGGAESVRRLAEILGVEAPDVGSHYAVVHCGATLPQRKGVSAYRGEPTCASADMAGALQACVYGCLGLGDCERACPYDAIDVIDGLAVVDCHKCTACGKCVAACPRDIITIEPFKADQMLVVACCSLDPARAVRSSCEVGCIACGICAKTSDLFELRQNLTRLDIERYDPDAHADQLKTASEKCPTSCLPFRGA